MEEIEGQPVVHRREEMGLAQADPLFPQGAADRGGDPAIVARRHSENGGRAGRDQDGLRPSLLQGVREPQQVRAEPHRVMPVNPFVKILPKSSRIAFDSRSASPTSSRRRSGLKRRSSGMQTFA